MSMSGSSYVAINTTRDEGYDIQFRFITTLGDGLLAIGKGLTFYILELANGRLNLHSSLLNKWEGVFIGSNLNDSNWQKVKKIKFNLFNVGTNLFFLYVKIDICFLGICSNKFISRSISC